MKKLLSVGFLILFGCGGGGGGGAELNGAYRPQFAPNTPRYEIALSDEVLEFIPGHQVVIKNGYGTKTWNYSVRGGVIIMKHADGSMRKHYALGTDDCIFYSKGDPTLELQYCK